MSTTRQSQWCIQAMGVNTFTLGNLNPNPGCITEITFGKCVDRHNRTMIEMGVGKFTLGNLDYTYRRKACLGNVDPGPEFVTEITQNDCVGARVNDG
ncbi:hypothetical protein Y032_0014g2412 [Ancylostoma ceylanicum]|uniref:Uncharacterized protein n=1 Tax=Ancylostoma ceylanicum TaxID=53326 RepID=A0A016VB61_9BILA|nr:hypothetical protein Y032_0014g2412 [Ancylostoma ceylanicum]